MGAVVVWIIECDGCLANYEGKQLVYFDTREEALSSVRPTQSDRWVRHGDTTYCGRCAPMPSTNRPSDSCASVEAAMPIRVGARVTAATIDVSMRTRRVWATIAAAKEKTSVLRNSPTLTS